MNVRRFPPPSSQSTNCVTLVRKEGHAVREPSLLRRSGSTEKRRSPGAARGGGPGAMEEQVGWKTRCRALGSRRGGCRPRGSGGVGPAPLVVTTYSETKQVTESFIKRFVQKL